MAADLDTTMSRGGQNGRINVTIEHAESRKDEAKRERGRERDKSG